MDQRAKYLGQPLFSSKVITTRAHTMARLLNLNH